MSRKRYFGLCVLMLTGAFAGAFTGRYAANRAIPVVHAQDVIGPANVRATSFTLVNPQGKVQATLRGGPIGAELILNDVNGASRVEIGPPAGIVIRDSNGRVVWSSPRGMGILPAGQ